MDYSSDDYLSSEASLEFSNDEDFEIDSINKTKNVNNEVWKTIEDQTEFIKRKDKVVNHVFQYLSTKDLINATEVSKFWYITLSNLKTFQNRISLNFSSSNANNPEGFQCVDSLKFGQRCYENININIGNNSYDCLIAENIIKKYSLFIKALTITKLGGHNMMLNEVLNLPKLTEVDLQVVCGRLKGTFLENVKTLKKLLVNGMEYNGLRKCLKNNHDLTELVLYENSFISYFQNDFSPIISFQLKKLAVFDHNNQTYLRLNGEFPATKWNKIDRNNFIKLLSTQNNLKALHLDNCHVEDLDKIILSSIEILEINNLVGEVTSINIPVNNVKVFLTNSEDEEFVFSIISHLSTLEAVFIYKLTKDLFDKIVNTLKLQRLNYFWLHDILEPGKLINLKNINCGTIYVTRSTKQDFMKMFNW